MKRIFISILAVVAGIVTVSCAQTNGNMEKDFLQLAADRYSVRSYDSKPVDQATIEKILKAGHLAPTAKNCQPQVIYVVKSEEMLKKLDEVSPCVFGAPLYRGYASTTRCRTLWISGDGQVLRSRTKETMGGAEVSEANGVPPKVAASQPGAVMIYRKRMTS